MGVPLSAVLAKLFMECTEENRIEFDIPFLKIYVIRLFQLIKQTTLYKNFKVLINKFNLLMKSKSIILKFLRSYS